MLRYHHSQLHGVFEAAGSAVKKREDSITVKKKTIEYFTHTSNTEVDKTKSNFYLRFFCFLSKNHTLKSLSKRHPQTTADVSVTFLLGFELY